ncbi:hypothetical protein I6F33_33860 [Bradyrhizobium sp. BRP20]|uniref:hypothetical protein n=1 Tax=unclassified Bradyrhizobium TaxID=2631580 RepID=UPI001CD656AE|nr:MULTISPECIES: hypothetical protein [unclassified Bradyrhizobium]MCA1393748.1 hypothetical protein [Bradyrhizobium sp. IC3123]MCA1437915.1 hypothetical protein [Bradyrhizobium sp. BRP20]
MKQLIDKAPLSTFAQAKQLPTAVGAINSSSCSRLGRSMACSNGTLLTFAKP